MGLWWPISAMVVVLGQRAAAASQFPALLTATTSLCTTVFDVDHRRGSNNLPAALAGNEGLCN